MRGRGLLTGNSGAPEMFSQVPKELKNLFSAGQFSMFFLFNVINSNVEGIKDSYMRRKMVKNG